MGTRAERQAANEAAFREVNERRAVIDRHAEATWAERDTVQEQDDRFPVLPGHESPEIEAVVERHERYAVVDKISELEPFVEDDPRGAPSS